MSRSATTFEPYVSRVATEWDLDSPGELWRQLEGSLVHVDISGFTNLSERLARKGRIGAEELTSVLNRVFGRMLEIVYERGGSLLKFGGDALLLFFDTTDHVLQATAATVEMRSELRQASKERTSVGRIDLKMSSGIHTGAIDFFLVGASHRELIVAGPIASTTTRLEETADAGEIVVSEEVRSRLPEDFTANPKGGGWILRKRKINHPTCGHMPRRAVAVEELVTRVPIALREQLAAGMIEPEHRIATVGFVKFEGVDTILSEEGPDRTGKELDALVRTVQTIAGDQGVTLLATDIDMNGGKIILTAGVPTSRDDDEGRMLRTARGILDSEPGLDVRIGVNRGHVFAGNVGTEFRSTYTVMGDTVNLAARLMAAAKPGELYASPTALDLSATLFQTEALQPFHVKGKDELVHAYSVGSETGEAKTVSTEGELPFVGRDVELSTLTGAIFDTVDGTGTVVTVLGDAGSGKSRLVREACIICSAVRAIPIRSESYGATTPYRPLRDVFRTLLDIKRDEQEVMAKALEERVSALDPELLPYLPFIGDVTLIDVPSTETVEAIEPRFRRDRLADVVVRVLDELLTSPTVFDIEDAQWMDDASAHLMERIAAATETHPWTVVVSRRGREEGFMPGNGTVIELGNLDSDSTKAIVVQATEAAPLRPHEIEAVVTRSGGNPLFLHEILQVVRDTGSVEELPDSLGSVVSSRIDALPPLARRILRYCSVLGLSFRTQTVDEILADDDLRIDSATRRTVRRFLVPDGPGRLRFTSVMVRDVAYDGLSFRRRQQLHLRAARVIERSSDSSDGVADLLALHYSNGGDNDRAWHYGVIAGDRAREIFANHEAAAFYERALTSARRLDWVVPEDKVDVLERLAGVLYEDALFDKAIFALREAIRLLPDDPVARADVQILLARAYQKLGKYSQGLRETAIGLKMLSTVHEPEAKKARARLRAFRAGILGALFRPRQTLEVGLQAVEEADEAGELEALARAYTYIDDAYQTLGQREMAIHEPLALEIFEDLGDLSGITLMAINLGVQAYADGEWDQAIAYYTRAQEVSRRSGNTHAEGSAAANLGEVLISRGRLDEADTVLEEARRVLRAQKDIHYALFSETQLGRLAMERGELDTAIASLIRVVDEANESGMSFIAVDTSVHLADAYVRNNDPDAAIRVIAAALELAGEDIALYEVPLERVRAMALIALGRPEEAAVLAEATLANARRQQLVYEEALLLLIRARAASPGTNTDDAVEAARLLAELGAPDPRL